MANRQTIPPQALQHAKTNRQVSPLCVHMAVDVLIHITSKAVHVLIRTTSKSLGSRRGIAPVLPGTSCAPDNSPSTGEEKSLALKV